MNVTPTIRSFPTEIFDYIIDYLHGDKESLCRCAFVCRTFLSSVRYHLFRTVRLHSHNCCGFLDLLRHAPSVAGYIQVVKLHVIGSKLSQPAYHRPVERATLQDMFWTPLFRLLPTPLDSVIGLEIEGVAFTTVHVEWFHTTFPNVNSLRLNRCPMNSVGQLCKLQAGFSRLKTAIFRDCSIIPHQPASPIPGGTLGRLEAGRSVIRSAPCSPSLALQITSVA
ncbi:hypothetical protein BXZ70DRAFT_948565 [Cristinia sonorae]|uniref:F-box domain-containing protein n=1 Tax=Cristinia sonorae TaxID=1940300 RepID=A0A8K0UJ30_9AGAR|nr:hypothetical protein BXZ70DRAFT_948565 [Cristinia sonorae]